ncbi:hypothetical protein C5167_032586 [Papaver somniferum]|uniref:Uncharacterized protein n=1 Tax=Papaver somniferum TaxID=3469 RepID=A0A4Y7K5Q9_PAPSO|nr:hypothetical protein C5167_032586 [Papaver somniferum]
MLIPIKLSGNPCAAQMQLKSCSCILKCGDSKVQCDSMVGIHPSGAEEFVVFPQVVNPTEKSVKHQKEKIITSEENHVRIDEFPTWLLSSLEENNVA